MELNFDLGLSKLYPFIWHVLLLLLLLLLPFFNLELCYRHFLWHFIQSSSFFSCLTFICLLIELTVLKDSMQPCAQKILSLCKVLCFLTFSIVLNSLWHTSQGNISKLLTSKVLQDFKCVSRLFTFLNFLKHPSQQNSNFSRGLYPLQQFECYEHPKKLYFYLKIMDLK